MYVDASLHVAARHRNNLKSSLPQSGADVNSIASNEVISYLAAPTCSKPLVKSLLGNEATLGFRRCNYQVENRKARWKHLS